MKKIFNNQAITLIALVITIIVLIIITSITINLTLGKNGILNNAKKSEDENNINSASEIMNLKITNIQIKNYAEKQNMPTLQELADSLCEDNEIEYVELSSKIASLDKITITNNNSIFTKLKEYPYEFEIDRELRLAAIDGKKVGGNTGGLQLKNCMIEISDTGTITVAGVENMISFSIIKDGICVDTTKNSTYDIITPKDETSNIYVIAIDKNANLYKSNTVEHTGKAIYLYNNGVVSDLAGELVFKYGVEGSIQYNTDNNQIYMRGASIGGDPYSGYVLVRTSNLIDLSKYSKLCVKADAVTTQPAISGELGLTTDVNEYRGLALGYKKMQGNEEETTIYEYTLPSTPTNAYPAVALLNGHSGTYTEITIHQMWLEQ